MNTEIELKYLVDDNENSDISEQITTFLQQHNFSFVPSFKALSNCYYDTENQLLRRFDMGLRIRSSNGQHEQTIKTAGKSLGGLHQRPEYNVALEVTCPDLTLFPDEIWYDEQNINDIQSALIPLFTTDFNRQLWTITTDDLSVIELVYDHGNISTNGKKEPICELELELLSGNKSSLFNLANTLFDCLSLRPGINSKAARGYGLWKSTSFFPSLTPLELIPLKKGSSITESFVTGASFCLEQLQTHIHAYMLSPSLAYLSKSVEILALLRHGFWLYEEFLPEESADVRNEINYFLKQLKWVDRATYLAELTNKTGNYVKKIKSSTQLFQQLKLEHKTVLEPHEITAIIYSARFNRLQLSLLNLLVNFQENVELLVPRKVNELLSFSKKALNTALVNVSNEFSEEKVLLADQYLSQHKLVNRCLLTGSWFGNLYEKNERINYRGPWLDIMHGLNELRTLWILHQRIQEFEQPSSKLISWHKNKVESLVSALDSSRIMALSNPTYWS